MKQIIQHDAYQDLPNPSLYLFDRQGGKGVDGMLESNTDIALADELNGLLCARCSHVITCEEKKIEVSGSCLHRFLNPAGIEFEIACFSQASGCRHSGNTTAEWTWFPGYSWRYANCTNCGEHLGWQYLSATGDSFYGLILARLVQAGMS